jgi:hypothetical protein
MRHDILKGVLRQIVNCIGVAFILDWILRCLPGLQAAIIAPGDGGDIGRLEGTGDTLMALGTGMAVVGVSVTHLAGVSTRGTAATTDMAAAARRDEGERRAHHRLEPNGYPFVPFSVRRMASLASPRLLCLSVWVWRLLGLPE